MIETVGDILRELCTINAVQDSVIYVIDEYRLIRPPEPRFGSFVSPSPFKFERRPVTLFQLRYRLMEAYRYERDEPAFDRSRFSSGAIRDIV